ncbi:phage late control D family protein [Nitrococcus mobilis]|uniref:Phage protein D n=1 Tax=Nitrococcus mobilis Nb-231 TaxID=314278 RepID=A4BR10_9GAMM|nr:contractile injection system protein, VgrG/Pvc8 family [Nitrococcus mobilis]EAR22010.1 hypothetical protein NB231_06466 [Nitrococcus mobilis Nb-231]
MTEALLSATVPVFLVDGETKGELARDIVRLVIEEATDGLKTLRARFLAVGPMADKAEEPLLYLDGALFDFGRELQVSIGPGEVARTIFKGAISAIEANFEETREPEIVVYAEDKLMDLRMTRHTRTYEAMSDAEIAEEIAAGHGINSEVDVDGPSYDVVQQWNLSDLAFLRERARLIQAEVWFQGDTMYFKSRGQRSATELTLVQDNHILALQARADLAHQRTAVRVSGYDAHDRDVIDEEAGGEAIEAEIDGGRTGPGILQNAFGARVSHRVQAMPLNDREAAGWAQAEMLRRARAFVQVSGVTRGSADMVVASRLTLQRVGRPFEGGGYYVTRVCHTYDLAEGFRTRFEAERPTIEG